MKEILRKSHKIGVIGVTPNEQKFGYKIYQRLKELKKDVYPISPLYSEIKGDLVYASVEDVGDLDLIVFVVNAKLSKEYVLSCPLDCILWFQPNTYDEEVLELVEKRKQKYVCGCVLVESENDEI